METNLRQSRRSAAIYYRYAMNKKLQHNSSRCDFVVCIGPSGEVTKAKLTARWCVGEGAAALRDWNDMVWDTGKLSKGYQTEIME